MTQDEAAVAIPSLPYADEDLVILSGVDKEHESNVYGYITTMDYQVSKENGIDELTSPVRINVTSISLHLAAEIVVFLKEVYKRNT